MLEKNDNPVIIKGKSLLDTKETIKEKNTNLTIIYFLKKKNKK